MPDLVATNKLLGKWGGWSSQWWRPWRVFFNSSFHFGLFLSIKSSSKKLPFFAGSRSCIRLILISFSSIAVATCFFWGVTRKIKNFVSLIYFMISKFLGYRKKMHHVPDQKRSIKCAYWEKGCKIVVRIHIDYPFPIGNKNDILFSTLYTFHSTFWNFNFHL